MALIQEQGYIGTEIRELVIKRRTPDYLQLHPPTINNDVRGS